LHGEFGVGGVLVGEALAVQGLGVGGDGLGGEAGLVGIGGKQGGDPGMAALSRRARFSGVSVIGGGSAAQRAWTSW